jgi:glutaredoxin
VTIALRVIVVVVAILLVIAVARLIGRWQRPSHPALDLGDLGPRPGIVLFTSTDCVNCKRARTVVESLEVPVREVTWELEPKLLEAVGVDAVPLVAVVDGEGRIELLTAGVPRRRPLRRAAQRAGVLNQ